MSVREFLAFQAQILTTVPECWIIVANSVRGRYEGESIVAAFDTKEMAEEYARASLLPTLRKSDGKISRAHRPDSVLWNFNPYRGMGETPIVVLLGNPLVSIEHVSSNPSPPSGPFNEAYFQSEPPG